MNEKLLGRSNFQGVLLCAMDRTRPLTVTGLTLKLEDTITDNRFNKKMQAAML